MSLITCPECQKQISEYASNCPNCGFQLTHEIALKQIAENKKPGFHESYNEEVHEKGSFHDSYGLSSPQKKMNKQNVEQKRKNQSVLIALGIIVSVFIYFVTTNNSSNTISWEQEDNMIEAYVMAQQFVEQRLKSPSTAKYPLVASECTTRMEGQKYKINAYVDSQNSFGASIRANFIAVVEQYEKGKWKLVDLQIN